MRRDVLRASSALLVFLALCSVPSQGQTVSPVIVEYVEKAQGKFEVINNSVYPLNVVLEPRSFSVDASGNPTFYPLDPGIRVRLSSMSFRLPAHQTYVVFYEAGADRLPAWFTIYATVAAPPTAKGMKIALALPHTVYLLTKKSLAPDSVRFIRAEYLAGQRCVEVEVENRGEEFGRVREAEIISASGKKTYASFPLFPGQRRTLRLEWEESREPQSVVLKFRHFKVEHRIRRAAGSQ